jgi:hypothetical protein
MNWKKSDWYIPADWLVQFGMLIILAIIAILAGVLLPIFNRLQSADLLKLYRVGVGIGCFGVLLLLIARWPLYRQHQFLSFGPGKLPGIHRKLYWLAYAVIVSAVLLLGIVWLRVG